MFKRVVNKNLILALATVATLALFFAFWQMGTGTEVVQALPAVDMENGLAVIP